MNKKMSLRVRLIISFFIITSFIWTLCGVLVWYEVKEEIDEFFDSYQLILARQFSSVKWQYITPHTQKKTDNIIKSLKYDGDEDDDALGFAIFNKQGEMVFNDAESGKYFPFNPRPSGFQNQKLMQKKEKWRIVWMESADENFIIAIGQELGYRTDIALEMVEKSMLVWFFGLFLQIIASIALIYRELSPIKELAKKILKRDPEDLSPIVEDIPNEIEPLIRSINNLFVRVEKMINKERSFISDAAHELRSPLTALKVQLEVATLNPDDLEIKENALQKIGLGIERATNLIMQLLTLSKLETITENMNLQDINWGKILENEINEQEIILEKKISQKILINKTGDFIKKGEPILLSTLMKNLLNNAIKYSPKDSTIKVYISDKSLEISNKMSSVINPNQIERIGERFFRPAGQKENGSGLGISIINRIAKINNCKTSFYVKEDKFFAIISKSE